MKIWATIIAVVLILSIMTVNVFGIAAEAGIAVGGIAIATEIIVSLGISLYVGASLKEALQEISTSENMPIRTWVTNTISDYASSLGQTFTEFAQDFCNGVSYTQDGVLIFTPQTCATAADFIDFSLYDAGLIDFVDGANVTIPDQSGYPNQFTISELIAPISFVQAIFNQYGVTFSGNAASAYSQFVTSVGDNKLCIINMPKQGQYTAMHVYAFNDKGIGSTITFDEQVSGRALHLYGMQSGVNNYNVTQGYCQTETINTRIYRNDYVGPNYVYYNNLGSIVTGIPQDISIWEQGEDVNYTWRQISDTLFDYAGTVAGYDALTGAIVDINDLINTWADVILGAVNDVFGLDIVGLDEPIDITLDQEMVDELEDTAKPNFTDDIDDIIDGDIDTPITGTNDEETVDPDRPFEYTGEYTLDLTEFFPFCIPYDLYNMLKLFDGEPVAPSWEWPITVPSLGISETIEVDLSAFDSVASVLRTMETIAFAVGLCWGTKKLIMGS